MAILIVSWIPVGSSATELTASLQAMLDQARPGDTVTIPEGEYEGPILVTKPVTLLAQGNVKITNPSEETALTIQSDKVTLQGIKIVDKRINSEDASLVIRGNQNVLERIVIETMGTGIQLRQASSNTLHNIQVIGKVKEKGAGSDVGHNHSQHLSKGQTTPKSTVQAQKGNGIDLFESHQNRIIANRITNVFDGIYVEKSNGNHIEQNDVEKSRYGYHFMGTTDTVLSENTGTENVTGAMLMETTKATVQSNQLFKQQKNPNSQGILLYDVTNSQLIGNQIEGNRVGLYFERSSGIEVRRNQLKLNFIGMQLLDSTGNVLTENAFVSNVIQAQAQDSTTDHLDGNYWDNLQGLDVDGDSRSDLPFEMNPLYLGLTDAVPPYQLFFQAPGFVFLENLFTNGTGTTIRDTTPIMNPPDSLAQEDGSSSSWGAGILGALLLLGSSSIIYTGVRKQ
ncbi:right-handed parallel beta-helix repeat-containing protein [Brevibacillus sp. NRS-1366]|uniref:right-handed parallel beta-helix repeat-containing protein n=1 Tax=Brevibacillus sp. NRS-1366 TaxID=3233899 RepID=UPI003D1BAD64